MQTSQLCKMSKNLRKMWTNARKTGRTSTHYVLSQFYNFFYVFMAFFHVSAQIVDHIFVQKYSFLESIGLNSISYQQLSPYKCPSPGLCQFPPDRLQPGESHVRYFQNWQMSDIYQNWFMSDHFQNCQMSDIYQNYLVSEILQNWQMSDIYQNCQMSDLFQNWHMSYIYKNSPMSENFQIWQISDIYQNYLM